MVLTSGHSLWIIFFTTFVLGVAMVAMVATANHRADSPSTGWIRHSRGLWSKTHRVCESEHAFTSHGATPNSARDCCPRRPGPWPGVLRTRRREAAVAALASLEARGEVGRHLHCRRAQVVAERRERGAARLERRHNATTDPHCRSRPWWSSRAPPREGHAAVAPGLQRDPIERIALRQRQ